MSLLPRTPRSSRTIESCIEIALFYALLSWGAGPERPEVRRALGRAGRAGGGLPQSLSSLSLEAPRPATELAALKPFQMDPGKDKEGVLQPSGPPARKKFVIPLDEDEIPPGVAKPLFKSTQSLTTVDTSAQAAPQTYAEYAISQPPGGAGATCPTGSEPLAGETPNQALKPGAKSNSIIVSPRQRGNPVLKFVRNVPWEFGDVIPDYVLGQSTCALFLSLRYHNLHPDYIHGRLQSLGKNFALRVLLIQVDVKDPQQALKELAKMCILADCTLILAWSPEEAGRYLETYKAYEQKPADLLMEKLEQDFVSRVTECLTTVKSVNKTDSQTLLTTFGSLEQLIAASREDLALCPGLGPQKARRLFDVLHEPFLKVPR
ncbi:DNA excision repair protein ERCC-1 isoform X1 [Piliocolobus tephrosceles]|uniref:DNA excision repair protein ERCC-1 n=2 Tax=Piliocolobus tephrosceles TaxID=591936 RepID=A0A8C9IP19_9PRIM|nr:DNA excision repair protein ERCC-1 isoform X1 [Piliocolobus tephrosceles]